MGLVTVPLGRKSLATSSCICSSFGPWELEAGNVVSFFFPNNAVASTSQLSRLALELGRGVKFSCSQCCWCLQYWQEPQSLPFPCKMTFPPIFTPIPQSRILQSLLDFGVCAVGSSCHLFTEVCLQSFRKRGSLLSWLLVAKAKVGRIRYSALWISFLSSSKMCMQLLNLEKQRNTLLIFLLVFFLFNTRSNQETLSYLQKDLTVQDISPLF